MGARKHSTEESQESHANSSSGQHRCNNSSQLQADVLAGESEGESSKLRKFYYEQSTISKNPPALMPFASSLAPEHSICLYEIPDYDEVKGPLEMPLNHKAILDKASKQSRRIQVDWLGVILFGAAAMALEAAAVARVEKALKYFDEMVVKVVLNYNFLYRDQIKWFRHMSIYSLYGFNIAMGFMMLFSIALWYHVTHNQLRPIRHYVLAAYISLIAIVVCAVGCLGVQYGNTGLTVILYFFQRVCVSNVTDADLHTFFKVASESYHGPNEEFFNSDDVDLVCTIVKGNEDWPSWYGHAKTSFFLSAGACLCLIFAIAMSYHNIRIAHKYYHKRNTDTK